jgi:hypothetical protein
VLALVCADSEELDERGDGEVRKRDAVADDVSTLATLRVYRRGEPAEPCRDARALLFRRHALNGGEVQVSHAGGVQRPAGLVDDLEHARDPHGCGVLRTCRSALFFRDARARAHHADGRKQRIHERNLPRLRPGREERALRVPLVEVVRDLERVREARARRGVRDRRQRVLVRAGGHRDPGLRGHARDVRKRHPHGLVRDALVEQVESAGGVSIRGRGVGVWMKRAWS